MFNDHETGDGEAFCRAARKHGLEGPCRSAPIGRGAWIKTKSLSRAKSVVVGWTGPEGSRPFLGTLLLGYFDNDGRLLYAGRVGTGMSQKTLALLHRRLKPLVIRAMPLAPKETRFGGKLALSRVH
jgi:ATP-dependent DNA ligase